MASSAVPVPYEAVQRSGINPWVIALTVTIATFMELLDTSIANVSLPYVAGGLGRSYDEVTWILTTYLVANAVILPMSAWLSPGLWTEELLHGMCRALHDHIVLLRHRTKPQHHADGTGSARNWWRRSCAGRAGDPGGYFSARQAGLGVRALHHRDRHGTRQSARCWAAGLRITTTGAGFSLSTSRSG